MLPAYRVRNGTGKFCDQACYMAHRFPNNKKCLNCNKPCDVRFCSSDCQRTYWNKNGGIAHKQPRTWKIKLALIEELGGRCVECGFDDIRALDIDHIDPKKKTTHRTGYTWGRRIKDWLANKGNLRLLCANCRRIHTWVQRGFGKQIPHHQSPGVASASVIRATAVSK